MELNGMEWIWMEWNGMEWDGMEWNGMEWNELEWNVMEWIKEQEVGKWECRREGRSDLILENDSETAEGKVAWTMDGRLEKGTGGYIFQNNPISS